MSLLIAAAILLIVVGLIIYNTAVSQEWHDDHRGEELLTENEHVYGGLFYVNGDDKRVFVPKYSGGGYTLNMGHPLSYLVLTLFLVGMALLMFWY